MNMVENGRKTTDGVWSINLCRDWKNGWEWSSLTGGYPNSGFHYAYFPSKNSMRIEADISGLADNAVPAKVTAIVREHWTGEEIKAVDFP